ncbi:hypothetical protein L226DRAFT_538155 [Lentinus tigrinus ALCF2SS1-7]|uniref:Hydrophobin n=1 Tax=Lentinus tigrinus ALCF2SS1-6 TaxID=1328759 RepID=A0A5C2RWQ8_9APHY|nr:hypothetical protein L227DRAFT_579743 [Lentinus tigrinus ALCF2SS1-6]RPD71286.1 hypothetical protein L226DRAFT_538155 [Lentinus tigrinus ALCF2SS1-7]
MFFSRAIVLVALPLLAVATSRMHKVRAPAASCCKSLEPASSDAGAAALKAISVVVQDVNVLVGLTCSPITVIGVGSGGECSDYTVSCADNSHFPLVGIDCVSVAA